MIIDTIISRLKHFSYRIKSRERKFTEIYNNKGFSGEYFPKSGTGSTLAQTVRIRQNLPLLFSDYHINSIIDAPCGDFTWMRHVNLDSVHYQGFDIVKSIVEQNRVLYSASNIQFNELDIVRSVPPLRADLILCRDSLVHLSNRDALRTLTNFKKSDSMHLLTTTFTDVQENADIVSGRGWRPLNLEKPPFNFPKPLALINEECSDEDGKYEDKCMGLWRLADIP